MAKGIFPFLLFGGGVALFGWLLFDGFRKGRMDYFYGSLHFHGRRDDGPIRFWLTAAAISFWLLAGLFGTVWWLVS